MDKFQLDFQLWCWINIDEAKNYERIMLSDFFTKPELLKLGQYFQEFEFIVNKIF